MVKNVYIVAFFKKRNTVDITKIKSYYKSLSHGLGKVNKHTSTVS
jgi:hypothetical protein